LRTWRLPAPCRPAFPRTSTPLGPPLAISTGPGNFSPVFSFCVILMIVATPVF
jgi:hypothetical protein